MSSGLHMRCGPHPPRACRRAHSGSALIIGLLLLLLMTLLSLVTTTQTRTDSRMSSNQLDQFIAFQAAEAALREAESLLLVPNPGVTLQETVCYYETTPTMKFRDWNGDNSCAYSGAIPGILEAPRYVIEQLPASRDLGGYRVVGEVYHARESSMYRIIAMSTGRAGQSLVVIQTTFSPPEA